MTHTGSPVRSLLDSCLKHVPEHGFQGALTQGIRENGYSDASHAALTSYDLVMHHLKQQRKGLEAIDLANHHTHYDKLTELVVKRLEGNVAIQPRLDEALAIMTKPGHLVASMEELHKLSDEFWWLAMDRTSDFSWYTKRMAVSSVYAASEMFMVQDKSSNYRDTMEFATERLKNMETLGYANDNTVEWLKFNAISGFNVVRSLTRM